MKKRNLGVLCYVLTILGGILLVVWGNRAVTAVAETIPVPRQACIVIDPGHGGVDGGATSCTGKLESSYNLEISLRLRDLLELFGYRTRMIRTTDESVYTKGETIGEKKVSDLKNRVAMVMGEANPILLSIHHNQFPEGKYSGAQVFYAGTPGSKALGAGMQAALKEVLGTTRKAKKCQGVYLMEKIRCPGILIECGFLSNPREAEALADPAYQKKLAGIIACGLDQFLRGA